MAEEYKRTNINHSALKTRHKANEKGTKCIRNKLVHIEQEEKKGKQDFVPKEKTMHLLPCAKEFTKRGSVPSLQG